MSITLLQSILRYLVFLINVHILSHNLVYTHCISDVLFNSNMKSILKGSIYTLDFEETFLMMCP